LSESTSSPSLLPSPLPGTTDETRGVESLCESEWFTCVANSCLRSAVAIVLGVGFTALLRASLCEDRRTAYLPCWPGGEGGGERTPTAARNRSRVLSARLVALYYCLCILTPYTTIHARSANLVLPVGMRRWPLSRYSVWQSRCVVSHSCFCFLGGILWIVGESRLTV
jgi:hypothetical protein